MENTLEMFIEAFIAEVKKGKNNGNTEYFKNIVKRTVNSFDGDLGDRQYLANSICYRMDTTYEKSGRRKTNWGYEKNVIPVIRDAFNYVNK